jgi:hypothetical protein
MNLSDGYKKFNLASIKWRKVRYYHYALSINRHSLTELCSRLTLNAFLEHLFSRKALIETVWHNEEPLYHCVHVDAAVFTNNDFFTVALFRYGSTSKYQVEVGLSGGDRFQLQVFQCSTSFLLSRTHAHAALCSVF